MKIASVPRKMAVLLIRRILSLLVTLLLGGFLGAALLRLGPGSDVDESDFDARYSEQTREAIHKERAAETHVLDFYLLYLKHAVGGDFGVSRSLAVPVRDLIRARANVTVRLAGLGLAFGWTTGLSLAAVSVFWRNHTVAALSEAMSCLAFSVPAAVLALLVFLFNGPVALVIGTAVFPRVFRYARDLFEKSLGRPQILAARARGVAESLIFLRYVARPAWAPLVAFAGVCVGLTFGAAIPVEVICDLPGLGQLAWKAALARDMPLLVSLTLLVTAVTLTANAAADLVLEGSRE